MDQGRPQGLAGEVGQPLRQHEGRGAGIAGSACGAEGGRIGAFAEQGAEHGAFRTVAQRHQRRRLHLGVAEIVVRAGGRRLRPHHDPGGVAGLAAHEAEHAGDDAAAAVQAVLPGDGGHAPAVAFAEQQADAVDTEQLAGVGGGQFGAAVDLQNPGQVEGELQKPLLALALRPEFAQVAGAQPRSEVGQQRLQQQGDFRQLVGFALPREPELHGAQGIVTAAQRRADDRMGAEVDQHAGRHLLVAGGGGHQHQRLAGKDDLAGGAQGLLALHAVGGAGGLLQRPSRPQAQGQVRAAALGHQPERAAQALRGLAQTLQDGLVDFAFRRRQAGQAGELGGQGLQRLLAVWRRGGDVSGRPPSRRGRSGRCDQCGCRGARAGCRWPGRVAWRPDGSRRARRSGGCGHRRRRAGP